MRTWCVLGYLSFLVAFETWLLHKYRLCYLYTYLKYIVLSALRHVYCLWRARRTGSLGPTMKDLKFQQHGMLNTSLNLEYVVCFVYVCLGGWVCVCITKVGVGHESTTCLSDISPRRWLLMILVQDFLMKTDMKFTEEIHEPKRMNHFHFFFNTLSLVKSPGWNFTITLSQSNMKNAIKVSLISPRSKGHHLFFYSFDWHFCNTNPRPLGQA